MKKTIIIPLLNVCSDIIETGSSEMITCISIFFFFISTYSEHQDRIRRDEKSHRPRRVRVCEHAVRSAGTFDRVVQTVVHARALAVIVTVCVLLYAPN